jgi:hypothetical protein
MLRMADGPNYWLPGEPTDSLTRHMAFAISTVSHLAMVQVAFAWESCMIQIRCDICCDLCRGAIHAQLGLPELREVLAISEG